MAPNKHKLCIVLLKSMWVQFPKLKKQLLQLVLKGFYDQWLQDYIEMYFSCFLDIFAKK